MNSQAGLSFPTVALFTFLVLSQILAVSLIPRTAGFTNIGWTIACLATYAISLWSLAYAIHTGQPLSMVVPFLSAVIPLATIAIGFFFYREAASLLKIGLLCIACASVAGASIVK